MTLLPQFLMDLETNMSILAADGFDQINNNLWYQAITREMPTSKRKERLIWLLNTAGIEYTNSTGADHTFDELVSLTAEWTVDGAGKGLELLSYQLEDTDGDGIDQATHWSRGIGEYAAYWPQKQSVVALLAGTSELGYDGKAFFATDHPLNPFDTAAGTYSNLISAKPIDTTNATYFETAVSNLNDVLNAIRAVKMPNGEDPRQLRGVQLLVPPALSLRAVQLAGAKFMAAASGANSGGTVDLEPVISNWGMKPPIIADELGAAFGGSDTSYYVIVDSILKSQMGGLIYLNREPFKILFHGPMTDAELARKKRFQWLVDGRNAMAYGHPYSIFKVNAT
jgi:phage major head subunit gpT-like protein